MVSFFGKIKEALTSSSNKISSGITKIFTHKKLDVSSIEELHELLITSDIGVKASDNIIEQMKGQKFEKNVESGIIGNALAEIIENILSKHHKPIEFKENELSIMLICGVNGNGKTTSIGKLAAKYTMEGKKVMVAACDTFRAAAKDQLKVWTDRAKVPLIEGAERSDPASVAYRAVIEANAEGADILMIDTAGRLQNQQNLMDELAKIRKVVEKAAGKEPDHNILVLDATTGQNAFSQVAEFKKIAAIDGLIVTKLDGTSKAGVVVGLAESYELPVYYIGIGEKIEDLKEFEPADFAKALVGA